MKSIFKFLFTFLAICSIVFILYKFWIPLLSAAIWATIILVFVSCPFLIVSGTRTMSLGTKTFTAPHVLSQHISTGPLRRLYRTLVHATGSLSVAIAPPIALFLTIFSTARLSRQDQNEVTGLALATSNSVSPALHIHFFAIAFCSLSILIVYSTTSFHLIALDVISILIFASLVLRLVSLLISESSVPTLMKLTIFQPYTSFIALMAITAIAAVFSTALFTNLWFSTPVTTDLLSSTAKSIFSMKSVLSNPSEALATFRESPQTAVSTLIGLILYATMITSLVRFKDFHRSDEDWINLAYILLNHGKPTVALRFLKHVSKKDQPGLYLTQALCYLKLNRLDDALFFTEKFCNSSPEPDQFNPTESYTTCGKLFMLITHAKFRDEIIIRLFRKWIQGTPNEEEVLLVYFLICGFLQIEDDVFGRQLESLSNETALPPYFEFIRRALMNEHSQMREPYSLYSSANPACQLTIEILKLSSWFAETEQVESDIKIFNYWLDTRFNLLIKPCLKEEYLKNALITSNSLLLLRIFAAALTPSRVAEVVAYSDELDEQLSKYKKYEGMLQQVRKIQETLYKHLAPKSILNAPASSLEIITENPHGLALSIEEFVKSNLPAELEIELTNKTSLPNNLHSPNPNEPE